MLSCHAKLLIAAMQWFQLCLARKAAAIGSNTWLDSAWSNMWWVCLCIRMYTDVYGCIRMYTDVYGCIRYTTEYFIPWIFWVSCFWLNDHERPEQKTTVTVTLLRQAGNGTAGNACSPKLETQMPRLEILPANWKFLALWQFYRGWKVRSLQNHKLDHSSSKRCVFRLVSWPMTTCLYMYVCVVYIYVVRHRGCRKYC